MWGGDMHLELTELALRMSLALLLGALIGVERQRRQRMAGLRTNALVALGAAAYTVFSMLEVDEVSPTRVAAQVVSGIGFLGAGVIMREGVNVRGLNTAATLWCAAAVGVFAGAGYYLPAMLAAGLVLGANIVLRPLAQTIGTRVDNGAAVEHAVHYELELECNAVTELHLRALVLQAVSGGPLSLQRLASRDLEGDAGRVRLVAEFVSMEPQTPLLEQAVRRFGLEPGVRSVSWRQVGRVGSD